MHDVIIIGLGPAGSTAAHTLASRGFKVAAFDKARFPRYKSCGGCVSVKVGGYLDFDVSGAIEETVNGAVYTYKSGREIPIVSDRRVGFNVMRDAFDSLLVDKAMEAGAETITGVRVTGAVDYGDYVEALTSDGGKYRAKFLIGADGASGFTGRELFGLKPRECAVSITSEVPYDSAAFKRGHGDGRLYIDFGSVPFGYAWIFPKRDYLSVGLAGDAVKCGGGVKALFDSFVSSHPVLKGLPIPKKDGWNVPVFYGESLTAVKGRIALAGDTGHLVDPFLGEGIYYAIRTGREAAITAARAIREGKSSLAPYQAWLEAELYPEFRACSRMSDLVYNHPRLWYSIVEKEPDIMLRFYNVIRGEESCASFYGWVKNRITAKPWKVIRRWVDSRFLPS